MANQCKVGNWFFRINPSNDRELQRASMGSPNYSHLWSAPNGERILDLSPQGKDVEIVTNRHTYVRTSGGNVSLSS